MKRVRWFLFHIFSYLIHARDDEKKARSDCTSFFDSAKAKDDGTLIFLKWKLKLRPQISKCHSNLSTYLNHFDCEKQRERKSENDQNHRTHENQSWCQAIPNRFVLSRTKILLNVFVHADTSLRFVWIQYLNFGFRHFDTCDSRKSERIFWLKTCYYAARLFESTLLPYLGKIAVLKLEN